MEQAIIKIKGKYCLITYRGKEEYGLGYGLDYIKTHLATHEHNKTQFKFEDLEYMLNADFDTDFEYDFNVVDYD
jgi:hypothetical protein